MTTMASNATRNIGVATLPFNTPPKRLVRLVFSIDYSSRLNSSGIGKSSVLRFGLLPPVFL